MLRHSKPTAQGFTIIELLIVVAIVAMLAALLFPTYTQAKKSAKITRSMAQMKQIVAAQHIYNSDLDEISLQDGMKSLLDSGHISKSLTRTGGNDILGFKDSAIYMWIPPTYTSLTSNQESRLHQWKEHVTNTGGNPLIILDMTHDDYNEASQSPFRTRSAIGAFWDGHVQRRSMKGRPDKLRNWESQ